jgi:uncharacterized protein (UPF0548 family)
MFLARRPSPAEIGDFLRASAALPLSYEPIGLAKGSATGFDVDEQAIVIGSGADAFTRAKSALIGWRHFGLGWVELYPVKAPVVPGTVVAVLVSHLGFWSLNGCRVVYGIGDRDGGEFGFAYGTLTNHGERGEEIFKVSVDRSGAVSYTIRAVAQPRAALARLGYPLVRSLQARFRADSARAMARAIVD